ncbi:hypothetical protein GCM10025768_02610 [Microbacterium pseudoresistens]
MPETASNGAAYPFDARPLTDPIDRAALADYARRSKASASASSGPSASAMLGYVVGAIMAVVAFVVAITVVGSLVASGQASAPLFIIVIVAVLVIGTAVFIAVRRATRIRRYRLHTFAEANAMSYVPSLADPQLPGMIFHDGRSRRSDDLVRGERPRFVEFANYQYTTGSGKNSTTHHWGYVAIKLDVPLPNIVLDAVSNNGLFGSNLPVRFGKHQRLSLEGDFDQYFALYCPEGYERDALYLFTPDIMARFMDNASQFDVEIVDDWLFLYAKDAKISTLEPARWAQLFSTVGAVLQKFDQWARWRDERLRAESAPAAFAASAIPSSATGAPAAPAPLLAPPPGVAPQGRRLKRTGSWVAVVGMVLVFGWILLQALRVFAH